MIDEKYIKPIPNYIAKRIRNKDKRCAYYGNARFYAYFTKMKGELVKITVACKNYEKQWFCKQVAVHGVHSENCLVRDMEYNLMGYSIGWYDLGLSNRRKRYEDGKWYSAQAKYYNPFAEVVNKKYALKFDAFKYSAVDKYPYHDVFKYLRIYEQYPQAEYFVKIGLQHLATNKTLLKKAAKDKNFRKWLIRNARQLHNEYGNSPYFSGKVILASYKERRFITMSNYFRITGYCESEDFCFILDCHGCYEKLWQFSSFLVQKGLKVLEVSSSDKFLDGNIPRAPENAEKLLLRANAKGKPEYITQTIDGVTYKVVKVADKFYVPDRTQAI